VGAAKGTLNGLQADVEERMKHQQLEEQISGHAKKDSRPQDAK
jgi:hypothetical protein